MIRLFFYLGRCWRISACYCTGITVRLSETFLNRGLFLRSMGKSKRWGAYNTKHPDNYETKEVNCISNKFSHTKKLKLKLKK